MKKENASRIVSMIDGKYVDEATEFAINKKHETQDRHASAAKQSHRFGWRAAAACIALAAVIGSAAFACAVEAKNYNTAAGFFEEYGLSTEGLSRAEVKAVYRDITEKRFSYGKTADVIRQAVPGWEIEQAEPTPEELAALWDQSLRPKTAARNGATLRADTQYVYDPQRGFDVFDRSVLECRRDGELLWTATFRDFYVEDCSDTAEGTVVWGQNLTLSSDETAYGWVALVNGKGNVKWQRRLEHGFGHEYVSAVLPNFDGTWAVFSKGDAKYLCFTVLDADGNEVRSRKTEVGISGIWNAARLGDGYIIQLGDMTTGKYARLCRMDRDGRLTESFSYEADDCDYHITAMVEFGGRIYLSAYAVPVQNDEGGRDEIADILDCIFHEKGMAISEAELTPLVRDNYTAVLLLCDPDSGSPETFYSVKGSLGSKLSVNDSNQLEWNVESITSTFFSPATSSFSVGGTCKVFRYVFNVDGTLIGQTDTGETVPYRR